MDVQKYEPITCLKVMFEDCPAQGITASCTTVGSPPGLGSV